MGVRKFWIGIVVVVFLVSTGIGAVLLYDHLDGTARGLQVYPDDIDDTTDKDIVRYENMSEDEQSVFRSAVDSENGLAPIPESADYSIWYETEYVKYQNETYRVHMVVE